MKFGLVSYFIISDISLNFTNRKGLISMKKFIPLPSQRFNMESENGTVISFGTIIFRNSIFNLGSAYVGVDWEPHKPGTPPHLQGSLRNLEATHPSKPRRFPFPEPTERWHCPSGSRFWWKTWTRSGPSCRWVSFIGDDLAPFIPGDIWGVTFKNKL